MKVPNDIPDILLLKCELNACGITQDDTKFYRIEIKNEDVLCADLEDCLNWSEKEINRLKKNLFENWQKIGDIARNITSYPEYNDSCSLNNILFLNSVKKIYLLSTGFDELEEISSEIMKIFNVDISKIDESLVSQFNDVYLNIRILHDLLMKEIYRGMIIRQNAKFEKQASVAGSWANLDLVWEERIFPYDDQSEHEEYMRSRTKAKQQQLRYNSEYRNGIYYTWQELRRNPYRFGDAKSSPYPQRMQLSIP